MVSWQERCTELLRSSNWPTSTWQSKVQPSFRMRSRSSSPFPPQAPQCPNAVTELRSLGSYGFATFMKAAKAGLRRPVVETRPIVSSEATVDNGNRAGDRQRSHGADASRTPDRHLRGNGKD